MVIERRRGDTHPDVCTVSTVGSRNATDISGCSFKMVVSSVPFPADDIPVVFTVDGTIVDPANGVVEFNPTDEQVARAGYFYYEVKMVDTYGKTHTLASDTYLFK